jgi:parallel beta-helix repeat protein
MDNPTEKAASIFIKLFLISVFTLPLFSTSVEAKTFKVDCTKGNQTIQKALDKTGLKDGDEIEVSGNCVENIQIRRDHIILRGTNGATITAADAGEPAIVVQGVDVRIFNFGSISGGANGIALRRSASANIDGNTIESNTGVGINVNTSSSARLTNNVIQNNGASGVQVTGASAQIFSNAIVSNGVNGIQVQEAGSAEVDNNTITDNTVNGIRVRRTSHIALSGNPNFGQPNVLLRNGAFGVRCNLNSSVEDPVGQTYGAGADANGDGDFQVTTGCSAEGAGFL